MVPCKDLTRDLVSSGFLKTLAGEKVLVLQTPMIIKFSEEACNQILSRYDPVHEAGGVILATPTIENRNRILLVNKVVFLENLSTTPERSFFRPDTKSDIRKACKDNSSKDKRLYIPMFFHSHPTIRLDYMRNINNLMSAFTPLETSEADQKFSLGLQIPLNGNKFLVPNALIARSKIAEQYTIIGFYGGGITPTDFKEYCAKLTGKTIEKIFGALYSWIKEDPNRIYIAILLGLLFAIPIIYFHRQAIPIIIVLILILLGSQIISIASQATDGLSNYLAIVKKEGTIIRIPSI